MKHFAVIHTILAALAWAMVVIASVALFAAFTSLVPCQYLPLDP